MRVYLLYAVTRGSGHYGFPILRAVYLDAKAARAEAARLNASPYAGRRNKFVVTSVKVRGEA